MAKLTIKINNEDNNEKKPQNLQNSLSTKINQPEENHNVLDNSQNQQVVENITSKNETIVDNQINTEQNSETPTGKAEFVNFVIEKFGLEVFGNIDKTKIDELFNPETQLNTEQIKSKIINEIVSQQLVDKINQSLNLHNSKTEQLNAEINSLRAKQGQFEQQIANLNIQLQDSEEQIFKTEKKYASTVAIADVIREMLTKWLPVKFQQSIEDLLVDSYNSGDKQNREFVIAFLRGTQFLLSEIENLVEDEKENLNKLYQATNKLFISIKGKIAPERRPLLDKIASVCNNYLKEFDFISPEQSLQIDTHLHNAEGKGGSMVKEGLSMAVVRRDTRKTVYYAEITTK